MSKPGKGVTQSNYATRNGVLLDLRSKVHVVYEPPQGKLHRPRCYLSTETRLWQVTMDGTRAVTLFCSANSGHPYACAKMSSLVLRAEQANGATNAYLTSAACIGRNLSYHHYRLVEWVPEGGRWVQLGVEQVDLFSKLAITIPSDTHSSTKI